MSGRYETSGLSCQALHLLPAQEGHRLLSWNVPRRFERIRVIEWTCHEHRVTFYEFCEAGGLAFIRRTVAAKGKTVVSHSDAWRRIEARSIWIDVLSGMAR
ncbi:hypothetical protein [Streptosporangium sandarakinum]